MLGIRTGTGRFVAGAIVAAGRHGDKPGGMGHGRRRRVVGRRGGAGRSVDLAGLVAEQRARRRRWSRPWHEGKVKGIPGLVPGAIGTLVIGA